MYDHKAWSNWQNFEHWWGKEKIDGCLNDSELLLEFKLIIPLNPFGILTLGVGDGWM